MDEKKITEKKDSTTTQATKSTAAPADTKANVSTQITDKTGPATETLPAGYLEDGYYASTENGARYLRSEYIEEHAQEIARKLQGMKPNEFEKMLRELKRSKKRTLPYEARRTAAAELLPMGKNLVRHKKAPEILIKFLVANLAAIKDDETWTAFYRHCQAISGLME